MEHLDEAPTTIKEVGIHIGYMRTDLGKLTKLVEELPRSFATKEEVIDLEKRINVNLGVVKTSVAVLESARKKSWIKNTISALLGAVLTATVGLLIFLIQYAITHQ